MYFGWFCERLSRSQKSEINLELNNSFWTTEGPNQNNNEYLVQESMRFFSWFQIDFTLMPISNWRK